MWQSWIEIEHYLVPQLKNESIVLIEALGPHGVHVLTKVFPHMVRVCECYTSSYIHRCPSISRHYIEYTLGTINILTF